MAFSRATSRLSACAFLAFFAAVSLAAGREGLTRAELELIGPPDLSSPRATLATLRSSVEQAYDILDIAYDEYRADPGFFPSPAVSEKVQHADFLIRKAMATLDLSQVPMINREQTGTETVFLLKEILDRLPTIKAETVPDAAAVRTDGVKAWTLPWTGLQIIKADNGPWAGEFVFSADTVASAREVYDAVSEVLERPDSRSDLYRFYTLTPGDLLPPKWYFWIERLPFWAQNSVLLGHAAWQWVGVLLALTVLFGGWWLIARAWRRWGATATASQVFVFRLTPAILLIGVSLLAKWVLVKQINVSGPVLSVASTLLQGLAYLTAAWVAYLLCAGIGERIAASSRVDNTSIDASLIRVGSRVLGIAAAIATLFIGASDIGLPVYGVIAGLGVGGLALGLAARPTLENLIGGFILYADRPVRVGEFCKFGDKLGTVEEIGLRSTRIRALDRTLVTVPNAEFSNMELINITRRDQTLLDTTIRLRYETTAAQMQTILDRIGALLAAQSEVIEDTIRVHFQELGTYALGIGIRAFIRTPRTSEFLKVQESILFGIIKIIEDAGAEIAFPPQTSYYGGEQPHAGASAPGHTPADH